MGEKKRTVGRPLKYESPEELQRLIDEYFEQTPVEKRTITGLAIALDTDRSILCNYEQRDEFSNTIKAAKRKIEHAYEMHGMEHRSAFDIFRMKNMGWQDKTEVDQTVKYDEVRIVFVKPDGNTDR